MFTHLFQLELRSLARERAARVLLALFTAALAYGLWNGARLAQRQRDVTAPLAQDEAQFQSQVRAALAQQAIDPKAVARHGSLALLPAAPLPLLATGQSDLSPAYESVVLWRLAAPPDSRSELENPSHLLAGRFDLAFVLVWLFPLFLLAFVYDLMAGDRESGTLRLALAQGVSPWRWMAGRALARSLPIFVLALLGTLASGFSTGADAAGARLAFALAVVLAYGLFWVSLALAVNAVTRTAAGAATALGAAWVLLVLVAPTLLNVAVEALYPTPSRPELIAAGRKASGDAEKRGGELVQSFYRDHPEFAPPGQQADFAAQHLTVQEEVARAMDPVRKQFDKQLAQQQAAVGRWRFVSPAIAAQEALTDLAGTGYWRHRAFREQVTVFKQSVSDFYAPKVHRRENLTAADLERWPRFDFREEPARAWRTRVTASLCGKLAFAALLALVAVRLLRPTRLGPLTS
jgi:ABC-2 type transport system permease protein